MNAKDIEALRAMLAKIEPCMDRWFNHWSTDAVTIRTFIAASPAMLDTIDAQAAEIARLREAARDHLRATEPFNPILSGRGENPEWAARSALVAALKETNNG